MQILTEAAVQLPQKLRDKGWSQYRLEKELEAPHGIVCHWIRGRRVPDTFRAARMQDLLDLDAYLWGVPARPKRRAAAS